MLKVLQDPWGGSHCWLHRGSDVWLGLEWALKLEYQRPELGESARPSGQTLFWGVGQGLLPMMDGDVSSCPSFPPQASVTQGSSSGVLQPCLLSKRAHNWRGGERRVLVSHPGSQAKESELQSLGHIKDELCHIHWAFYTNKNLTSGSATESSSVLGRGLFFLFQVR